MNQLLILILLFCFQGRGVWSTTFTVVNKCGRTVWPGVVSNAGSEPMGSTGFALAAGDARMLKAPVGWAGRFWARTGCTFDASGRGNCTTGDCRSSQIECNGAGDTPPATLVEFKLNGNDGKDYYDVSLVDGYNVPVLVEAKGGAGVCAATGCAADLNRRCPDELKLVDGDGCRSACAAFGKPQYCCSGDFSNPNTCQPSVYSQMFKSACPRSYSYAFDDASSTFTCSGADYTVTFCPDSVPSRIWSAPSPPKKGVFLQDDSWLASLAMGDASPKMMRWTSQFLQQATLVIATTTFCALAFYL